MILLSYNYQQYKIPKTNYKRQLKEEFKFLGINKIIIPKIKS